MAKKKSFQKILQKACAKGRQKGDAKSEPETKKIVLRCPEHKPRKLS